MSADVPGYKRKYQDKYPNVSAGTIDYAIDQVLHNPDFQDMSLEAVDDYVDNLLGGIVPVTFDNEDGSSQQEWD